MSRIRKSLTSLLACALVAGLSAAPAQAAGEDHYRSAVAHLLDAVHAEDPLPLQAGSHSILLVHPQPTPKGTLVMFHGFTAGTWQFLPLAEKAFAAGFNVYIPRLPGHGLNTAQGVEDPSQLLTHRSWREYQAFGERAYADAAALGGPVQLLGLSVGGNVALDVAENHPEVKSVVAYAPFLRRKAPTVIFDVAHVADVPLFGLAGDSLHRTDFSWGEETRLATAAGTRPGHSQFTLGHIYGALELGRDVLDRGRKLRVPVQFFVTAVDDAADNGAIRSLYQESGGAWRHGWYFYPESEGIPHPMLHPMEDRGRGHTPALYEMTMKFLETGRVSNRDR